MRYFLLILSIALPALAVGAQSVSGSMPQIKRGGSAEAVITLAIPSNVHVNSNRPSGEYLIPTKVVLTVPPGVEVSAIKYPKGKMKRFEFSDEPLSIYEGRVRFIFKVSVPQTAKIREVVIRAEISFQPCTDTVCYPPRTKKIVIRSSVR